MTCVQLERIEIEGKEKFVIRSHRTFDKDTFIKCSDGTMWIFTKNSNFEKCYQVDENYRAVKVDSPEKDG